MRSRACQARMRMELCSWPAIEIAPWGCVRLSPAGRRFGRIPSVDDTLILLSPFHLFILSFCHLLVISVRYNRNMPLLIDGHNLIGQTPGLSLADPDDEGDLVMLLRRYTTAQRGRKVVVVFDHGVYGHPQTLDGYGVSCHFARSPQDADAQLIKRMRALKRPRDWTLVTSDRQVMHAAEEYGVRVISSHVFVRQLLASSQPATAPQEQRDIRQSDAQIDEWLRLFGELPDND